MILEIILGVGLVLFGLTSLIVGGVKHVADAGELCRHNPHCPFCEAER